MRSRRLVALVTGVLVMGGLTGCGTQDSPAAAPAAAESDQAEDGQAAGAESDVEDPDADAEAPDADADAEAPDAEAADADEGIQGTGEMPAGLRPGSDDFPFPVPEDWPELTPFGSEKVGKKTVMHAIFEYPGDAEEAAATYRSLLEEAGFNAYDSPLGAQVNDASLYVDGVVAGVPHSGGIDFDTDFEGTPRAIINLVVDE